MYVSMRNSFFVGMWGGGGDGTPSPVCGCLLAGGGSPCAEGEVVHTLLRGT